MTERERHLLCSERFYRLLFTEDRGGVADPKDTRSFIEKIRNQYESEEEDMTKIRDYNLNGTMILGVDAGYGNIKTARTCFPTSVRKSEKPPVISRDYVEYNGAYYILGKGTRSLYRTRLQMKIIMC